MIYFKLYDKDKKEIITELYEFSNLTYTKVLNGTWQLNVKIPLKYLEENEVKIIPQQTIELWKDNKIIWWGVISNPCPSGVDLDVSCLGYYSLLMNRKFTDMDWNDEDETWKETFYNKRYGQLITYLITRVNNISDTGILIGTINDSDIKTDRTINWEEDLKEKIDQLIEDSNCYFTIDSDRKFNFFNELGEDKTHYIINDYNIIGEIALTIDSTQIYNRVIGRVVYKDDNDVLQILKTVKEDKHSIELYGLKEYVYSNNELRLLETLEEQCKDYLETYKNPLENIELEVAIKDEFDIFDIEPGDYVTFNSDSYNYNKIIRVLEYTVNLITNTVKISLGNSIFREQEIKIFRFNG